MKKIVWLIIPPLISLAATEGGTVSIAPSDLWLIRTDSLGDTLWSRIYENRIAGGFGGDCAQQTGDGGYILTGNTGSGIPYLLRLDSLGNTLWETHFETDVTGHQYSIYPTIDGGYILLGNLIKELSPYSGGSLRELSNSDIWLTKVDSLGNTLWTQAHGGNDVDEGTSLVVSSDGGFVITGFTVPSIGYPEMLLLKTDSLGDTLWSYRYEGFGFHINRAEAGDNYIVAGSKDDKIWLFEIDSTGGIIWEKTYDLDGFGMFVSRTSDGGYIIAANMRENLCLWLLKTDSVGEITWKKSYFGETQSYSRFLRETSDGGYIVIGSKGSKPWLFKVDSQGDVLWEKEYPSRCFLSGGRWFIQTVDNGYLIVGS